MTFNPFKPEEVDDAKRAFAKAYRAAESAVPFPSHDNRPDPFKVALTVWPEATGELTKALWAASNRWHEDPTVSEIIKELIAEEEREEIEEKREEAEELLSDEFKLILKAEGIAAMRKIMNNDFADPKDRIAAFDRLSKSRNLDDQKVENDLGRVIGVIGFPLTPVTNDQFEKDAWAQQSALQTKLNRLHNEDTGEPGENARLIN